MPSDTCFFLIERPGESDYTFALTMPLVTIGRTPDNSLTLTDAQVSRHHAELRIERQVVTVTDLGSTNGTRIGGTRILPNQPVQLTDGVVLSIGPFSLTFRFAPEAPEAPVPEEFDTPQSTAVAQLDAAADLVPPAPEALDRRVTHWLPVYGHSSRYIDSLPSFFSDTEFLHRFLLIFETIWEPLEQRQDHIAMYFDPRSCPPSFLPWLATWLDLEFNPHWPEARQRSVLSEALELYRWRGTLYGLVRLIEIFTGSTPDVTETPGRPYLFHIRLQHSADQTVDRESVERLIQTHKPAHTGYTLEWIG